MHENLEKIKKYSSFYDWYDHISIYDLRFLISQAEKVEELEKRFKEQIQNNYCIICGDDATEDRQGSYYCFECCK